MRPSETYGRSWSRFYRRHPRSTAERDFYFGFASACALVAFLSFLPTYWLPLGGSSLQLAPTVHLHAAVQFGWLLLFVIQAGLAGSGRIAMHRALGLGGDGGRDGGRARARRGTSLYWIGGGLLVALQVLRIPFAYTPAWQSIADSIIEFGAPLL